jgi:phosphatidylglycerophosphatase A
MGHRLFRDPVLWLATGGGVGWIRGAPGTWGSLIAVPLAVLLRTGGSGVYWVGFGLCVAIGVPLTGLAARRLGLSDPPMVVWDEIAGQLLTLGFAPMGLLNWSVGFLLFRFFDILKPGPIRWIDRKGRNGWGIMADDLAAGLVAGLFLSLFVRIH